MERMDYAILFSGGYDSTMVLFHMANTYPHLDFKLLYVDYGQPEANIELNAVGDIMKHPLIKERSTLDVISIDIPWFTWDKAEEGKENYLPMRNVILSSILGSYCEAHGINWGGTGFIKSNYRDTDKTFSHLMDNVIDYVSEGEVRLESLASDMYKEGLIQFNVTFEDVHFITSKVVYCTTPKEYNEPCQECVNCKDFNNLLESNRIFIRNE